MFVFYEFDSLYKAVSLDRTILDEGFFAKNADFLYGLWVVRYDLAFEP